MELKKKAIIGTISVGVLLSAALGQHGIPAEPFYVDTLKVTREDEDDLFAWRYDKENSEFTFFELRGQEEIAKFSRQHPEAQPMDLARLNDDVTDWLLSRARAQKSAKTLSYDASELYGTDSYSLEFLEAPERSVVFTFEDGEVTEVQELDELQESMLELLSELPDYEEASGDDDETWLDSPIVKLVGLASAAYELGKPVVEWLGSAKCPNCGASVSSNWVYCPSCRHCLSQEIGDSGAQDHAGETRVGEASLPT